MLENTDLDAIGTELKIRISELLTDARSQWQSCVIKFEVARPLQLSAAPKWLEEEQPYLSLQIHYADDLPYAENIPDYVRAAAKEFRTETKCTTIIDIHCIKHPSPSREVSNEHAEHSEHATQP